MFQNHAQTHLRKLISHVGLYQRLVEPLLVRKNNPIEIKPMTLDQHFKINHIQKIKLLLELISDQVIEVTLINLVLSKIKCKVVQALNYTTLNGEINLHLQV
jgi:hypothetical protein